MDEGQQAQATHILVNAVIAAAQDSQDPHLRAVAALLAGAGPAAHQELAEFVLITLGVAGFRLSYRDPASPHADRVPDRGPDRGPDRATDRRADPRAA